MKKVFMMLLGSVVFLASCGGEDDGKLSDEALLVKSWKIDSYTLENLPSDYSGFEGLETSSLYGESSLTMSFEKTTYTRSLIAGTNSFDEDGEWTLVESELSLDPTGSGLGLNTSFLVDLISEDDLILRSEETFLLYSDMYADTVSTAYEDYVDSLAQLDDQTKYDSISEIIYQPVTLDVVYDFDVSAN